MGSALACPPSTYAQNKVTLVGSPLDDSVVDSIQTNHHHPNLKLSLPSAIETIKLDELTSAVLQKADVIVIGVSSSGIDWVCDYLLGQQANPPILALVTKGLVSNPDSAAPPLTYADALNNKLPQIAGRIVGIGGPCIARELALGYPTRVSFAASHQSLANQLREYFQTDTYRINTRTDIVELEACAALKNFICIGVSAMLSAHPLNDSHAKNPLAALFNQAVREIYILSRWIAAAAQLSEVQSNTAQSNTNSIDAKVPDIPGP